MNLEGLNRKVDALAARLEAVATGSVEYTSVTRTSAAGDKDYANYSGNPSDQQRLVRRMSPWGLASRYVPGVAIGIAKAIGGAFNALALGIATAKYGPGSSEDWPALEEGETCLYCSAAKARVWLDKDGVVHVDAANGKDVIVNGGSAKVARVGDDVDMGTWQVQCGTGILAACIIAISWTPPGGGTPTVFSVTSPGPFPLTAKVSAGAANFKG